MYIKRRIWAYKSTKWSHRDGSETTADLPFADYDGWSIDDYTTLSHDYSPKTPIMHLILPDGQHEKGLSLNSIRWTRDRSREVRRGGSRAACGVRRPSGVRAASALCPRRVRAVSGERVTRRRAGRPAARSTTRPPRPARPATRRPVRSRPRSRLRTTPTYTIYVLTKAPDKRGTKQFL